MKNLLVSLVTLAAAFALVLGIAASRRSPALASPPENSPISLTNPDGQSLTLETYNLRAAVHGALALVEMEMVFRNPQARQMEGRFIYTLPPGATISRFAKEVNGKLMEGEVVERLRAQAIFTEILHTMRDPALLESDQGNRFSARIFPVPASATVRLLLAFSQVLPLKDGARKLTIPLAGLPAIGAFDFTATGRPLPGETSSGVVMDKNLELGDDLSGFMRHSTNFEPKKDIELTFKAAPATPIRALKAGNFQMVQFLYAPADAQKISPPSDWNIYVDTSASGADIELPRLQALEKFFLGLVPVLHENVRSAISVSAFDLESEDLAVRSMINVPGARPFVPELLHKLRGRHALGATNLETALKKLGEEARAAQTPCTFVLASDGIPTWGAREPAALLKALGEWPARHTLHALVIGTRQDERILKSIVEHTNGRIVALPLSSELDANVARAIAELRAPLGAHFEVYDEGTAWIYPKEFFDVRPGTELIAFSEMKEGGASKPGFVQRAADGKLIEDRSAGVVPLEAADFAPLLKREAYKAYLEFLDKSEQHEGDATRRASLRHQRIEVSVKNRVLCPLTSLLVLESEHDYQRFQIDRSALADVMQIGAGGIELRKRSAQELGFAVSAPPTSAPKKVEIAAKDDSIAKIPAEPHDPRTGFENFDKAAAAHPFPVGGNNGAVAREEASSENFAVAERLKRASPDPDFGEAVSKEASEQSHLWNASTQSAARQGGLSLASAAEQAQPAVVETPVAPLRDPAVQPSTPPTESNVRALSNPVTIAPVNAPPGPPSEGRRFAVADAATAAEAGKPEWVGQNAEVVSDEKLSALRAAVKANPTDRRARNAYADALCKAKKWDNLQAEVFQWLPFDPENPAVYEYLGKSATGLNDGVLALRAYSSIAEIAPNRAALLARSGWLLLTAKKFELAEAMFTEALKNRQDDANIHRGLALSCWLGGKYEAASVAYETALMKDFNPRYGDVKRVLREECAYVLRAWRKHEPAKSDAILARAQKAGADLFRVDALRVTMCWETDANDVDLHLVDPRGEECFYSHKNNASGLELYSDQTQGLGPEVIRGDKALPGTYHIAVNYFSAGPMGVSRGVVVVMKPVDGVDESPELIPFALIEGGRDLRYIGSVSF